MRLSRYHYALIILGFVFVGVIIHLALDDQRWQHINFHDPLLGFEARGTLSARALNTWKLFMQHRDEYTQQPKDEVRKLAQEKSINITLLEPDEDQEEFDVATTSSIVSTNVSKDIITTKTLLLTHDHAFCGQPTEHYAHVLLHNDNQDFLSLKSLQRLCLIDRHLRQSETFSLHCESVIPGRECCANWSLVNLLAVLAGQQDCTTLNQNHLNQARSLLSKCAPYYAKSLRSPNCVSSLCTEDEQCRQHASVLYTLLHYLLDRAFVLKLLTNSSNTEPLHRTAIFLPLAAGSHLLNYYEHLRNLDWTLAHIRAAYLGIYDALFDQQMLRDLRLAACALVALCILLIVHTRNFSIVFSILAVITLSLLFSYYLYVYILQVPLFPFMNSFALVITIALGADNALILAEGDDYTLRSTLVASTSTVVAFLSSFSSHVTAVRCFSLFASIVAMVNFVLTAILFPSSKSSSKNHLSFVTQDVICQSNLNRAKANIKKSFWFARIQIKIMRILANSLAVSWLLLLFTIALALGYISVTSFRLAEREARGALFTQTHLLEQHSFERLHYAWFRDANQATITGWPLDESQLKLYVLFGIQAADTGNFLDPFDRGNLQFQNLSSINQPEVQAWLYDYCDSFQRQSFMTEESFWRLPGCFMHTFYTWIRERKCEGYSTDRKPCCMEYAKPWLSPELFEKCTIEYQQLISFTPSPMISALAGLWYPKRLNQTQASVIVFELPLKSAPLDEAYDEYIEQLNDKISTLHSKWIASAPVSLSHGWFYLEDAATGAFRKTLLDGVWSSIGIGIVFAGLATVASTKSIIYCALCMLSVGCSVSVSMGILALLGWRLGVMESVIITSAGGLSVDYIIHYALCYQHARKKGKSSRIAFELTLNELSSPISMAAITTGLVGVFMCASDLMPYIKIGTFLIVISLVNWFYAFTFLMPLLLIVDHDEEQKNTIFFLKTNSPSIENNVIGQDNFAFGDLKMPESSCNYEVESTNYSNIRVFDQLYSCDYEELNNDQNLYQTLSRPDKIESSAKKMTGDFIYKRYETQV